MKAGTWILVLALATAGIACNPDGDDSSGSCTARSCAINQCASRGWSGGHCTSGGQCICDGTQDPSLDCVPSACDSACRTYVGESGGTCVATGVCQCYGGTDGGGDTASDVPYGRGSAHGIVMGPGMMFPVSGAAVYALYGGGLPDTIPSGVYCPRCLELTGIPHTFSAADGSFRIDGLGTGNWNLVVEKGQFRRVSPITISSDGEDVEVPVVNSTLPSKYDPSVGDYIPRIAVALGSYDSMEDIFAKVGMAALGGGGVHADLDLTDWLQFDIYDNGGGGLGTPSFSQVLTSDEVINQYQIIFIPCSSSTNDSYLSRPAVRDRVRNWVAAGGKWYVADWSYDFVEQIFPEAMDMYGDDNVVGDADTTPDYTGPGHVVDPDMSAWLSSMGHNPANMDFEEIYDNICGLGTVHGTDEDGNPIDITPKTWVEGPQLENQCGSGDYPYTVTVPFGCGRVLFTTYHSVGAMGGAHEGLMPQEQILWYLVMEIGVCTDEVVIW